MVLRLVRNWTILTMWTASAGFFLSFFLSFFRGGGGPWLSEKHQGDFRYILFGREVLLAVYIRSSGFCLGCSFSVFLPSDFIQFEQRREVTKKEGEETNNKRKLFPFQIDESVKVESFWFRINCGDADERQTMGRMGYGSGRLWFQGLHNADFQIRTELPLKEVNEFCFPSLPAC